MIGFFTIILVSGLLAKLVDAWLRKSEKEKLTTRLAEIWLKFDSSSLTSMSQAPLRLFSIILDTLLGNKVFTGRAIWRTSVVSACLVIICLSVGGIAAKTPFAFGTSPWRSFDEQQKFLAAWPNALDQQMQNRADLRGLEALNRQKSLVIAMAKYNTPAFRLLYSISTIIMVLLLSTVVYVISFALSRMMIREAMEANTYLLMLSVLFLNLCIGTVIATIGALLMASIAYPFYVVSFGYTLGLLLRIPILNVVLLLSLAPAVWYFGLLWIKIVAIVATLPMIGLILVLSISWFMFPFRKQIKYLLSEGMLRVLEHEKGIFVLISVTFSCIGGIAVAIARAL
jgi:hypothetical protein